jgi:hypothetical protein
LPIWLLGLTYRRLLALLALISPQVAPIALRPQLFLFACVKICTVSCAHSGARSIFAELCSTTRGSKAGIFPSGSGSQSRYLSERFRAALTFALRDVSFDFFRKFRAGHLHSRAICRVHCLVVRRDPRKILPVSSIWTGSHPHSWRRSCEPTK